MVSEPHPRLSTVYPRASGVRRGAPRLPGGHLMKSLRVILLVVVSVVLGAIGVAPASAAKPPLATPQITSVVAVDTRTATVTWTPVKGADHYVLEWAPAMRLYTSATSATVTDLYPGDDVGLHRARRDQAQPAVRPERPTSTSASPPRARAAPNGYAADADTVKLWWGGGIGCYTYELAIAQPDGTYSTRDPAPELRRRPVVAGLPGPGHHGVVRRCGAPASRASRRPGPTVPTVV